MSGWPFGDDADEHDPLIRLRIAVTGSHPTWSYLVGFDRESAARPTDREAGMLASYLEEYKSHHYGPDDRHGFRKTLVRRPLDVDDGANGVIFHKYGEGDWGYRRQSWIRGPRFVPPPPLYRERYPQETGDGPLALEQVMDRAHNRVDRLSPYWQAWKTDHPEAFGGEE